MNGDIEGMVDESVNFLPVKDNVGDNKSNKDNYEPLLTREDLMQLDSVEPGWKRARLWLMIFFWVLWFGLLGAAVTIIVFTPKCPPRPKLEFWQSKVAYWVDPFAFKDSGDDMIGDLRGLIESVSYIKDTVGAGYIILGSFLSGYYTNKENKLNLIDNFTSIDPVLGTMDDFRSMVRTYHKNGLEVVITLDFNAVSISHPWAKETSMLKRTTPGKMFARDGEDALVSVAGESYYSVGDKSKVDLNLQSEEVVKRLLDVVSFWVAEGVDGILLSDAAFFVEETSKAASDTLTSSEVTNKWFSNYPSNQLFTNGSVNFVRAVRKVMDETSKLSTKKRLLAVDPGNYGYGLRDEPDNVLQFLGTEEDPVADLVISKQFVKDRGWRASPLQSSWLNITIKSYDATYMDMKSKLGLVTSSPSDQRHDNVLALASLFLLPGSPILYYGSELATSLSPKLVAPQKLFPKGKIPFPNLSEQDSVLTCHLPMPWSRSGFEFSTGVSNNSFMEYLQAYEVTETVESASSIGRGPTPLRLIQKLINMRKTPSLLWGEFQWYSPGVGVVERDVEIFVRKAEQFPAVIIALLSPSSNGAVYDFSSVCDNVTPRVVYPPKDGLSEDATVESKAIYLYSANKQSVYVFECS